MELSKSSLPFNLLGPALFERGILGILDRGAKTILHTLFFLEALSIFPSKISIIIKYWNKISFIFYFKLIFINHMNQFLQDFFFWCTYPCWWHILLRGLRSWFMHIKTINKCTLSKQETVPELFKIASNSSSLSYTRLNSINSTSWSWQAEWNYGEAAKTHLRLGRFF